MALVNKGTFDALTGETFQVEVAPGELLGLELIEVRGLDEPSGAPRNEPFSVLFRGPLKPSLPQQTYPFRQAGLGEVAIFIVPVGHDQQGTLYEAIFN